LNPPNPPPSGYATASVSVLSVRLSVRQAVVRISSLHIAANGWN